MLQRNTSGYPLQLPTTDPPVRLEPGDDIDHEQRLAGCTPVDELDTDAQPDPEPESATSGNTVEQPQHATGGNTAGGPLISGDGSEQTHALPSQHQLEQTTPDPTPAAHELALDTEV